MSRFGRYRRTAFVVVFLAWTVMLLVPVPTAQAERLLGKDGGVFVFSKLVHVTAYAFLTLLGGTLPGSRRGQWQMLLLLSLHGFATEFVQQFVGRGSSLRDVGIDHVGIVLGVAIGWRFWQRLRLRENRESGLSD